MLAATISPPTAWSEQALQRLRELTEQPALLVLVLLAANAVTRPYANIVHDARLYSVQVLNQVAAGAYDSDLYFRYGSQDKYSIFSMLMAPIVGFLGLKLSFFVVYLAGNILLMTGLVAMVRQLVEDRLLALLSLVYLAIAPLPYAGLSIFHVHEPFLTPRLLAAGLVLLGLSQLLQARLASSFALMVVAALLHPLIAAGGFLMWGGVLLIDKLGWRLALAVSVILSLGVMALLATPSLAGRILGDMDYAWREAILKPTSFNFTTEWDIQDWCNVLFCMVGIGAGIWLFSVPDFHGQPGEKDQRRAWFLVVAGLVGMAAVVGTMIAERLPYALPFQGQPYRALWILKVLQAPLCLLLANRLMHSKKVSLALLAFIPLGYLFNSGPVGVWYLEWACPLFFLPLVVLALRGLERQPRRPDWLICSLAVAFLFGEMSWCFYRETLCIRGWDTLLNHHDMFDVIRLLLLCFGLIPWTLLILGLTAWSLHRGVSLRTLGLACLAICLAVQATFFIGPNTPYIREHGTRYLGDTLFARDFLQHEQAPAGKLPTVYSALGRVDYLWLELKVNCYFDWCQTSGVIFQRQTAMEGERRALLVGPFEIERFRQFAVFLEERMKRNFKRFFEIDIDDAAAPTIEDLARLCREPELDYAILEHEFPGLYSATNGRVYVYDCQKVRTKLNEEETRDGR